MILKLIFSVFLGFIIGLERELHGKVIGIKTVSLVTLGATLFTLMSPNIEDYSRIVAQVVSGISFICAGVLIKSNTHITGLTTSAILWVSAAIGCLVGMEMYIEASIGTLFILLIAWCFPLLKKK